MALGLHFKPVMLTVSLPGAAYSTKGDRTAGLGADQSEKNCGRFCPLGCLECFKTALFILRQ